jgi:hypothetical protein
MVDNCVVYVDKVYKWRGRVDCVIVVKKGGGAEVECDLMIEFDGMRFAS